MQFSKTGIFLLLTAFIVLPFFLCRIMWLFQARSAAGTMCFMGKTLNGQFSSEYPVIKFSTDGHDTVFVNGNEGAVFEKGATVPLKYQKHDPSNARINSFGGIWLDTVINAAVPFLLLLVAFLHPGIIPRHAKILIGKKPFIMLQGQQPGNEPV